MILILIKIVRVTDREAGQNQIRKTQFITQAEMCDVGGARIPCDVSCSVILDWNKSAKPGNRNKRISDEAGALEVPLFCCLSVILTFTCLSLQHFMDLTALLQQDLAGLLTDMADTFLPQRCIFMLNPAVATI
ncbi:hypothetical protein GS399_01355 [Pedobacter sp. HMF7647]|uniref:Uncharacterized protein n=1 Tax=Hufsiella arboris TaxID=2695275 RepID=A0A7K1Y4V2_9SPHI|nr:hypothetical protein [Hufsiella arboris]MXV49604.1 hypothetical protein [Hufsiella arboris]